MRDPAARPPGRIPGAASQRHHPRRRRFAAQSLRESFVFGEAKFEDVTTTHFDCSSAKVGGDLGFQPFYLFEISAFLVLYATYKAGVCDVWIGGVGVGPLFVCDLGRKDSQNALVRHYHIDSFNHSCERIGMFVVKRLSHIDSSL